MKKSDKSIKILGAIAAASTALFIFKSRTMPDSKQIEGLNINIDPEKMVDNIKPYISTDPELSEKIANIAKKGISKLLDR